MDKNEENNFAWVNSPPRQPAPAAKPTAEQLVPKPPLRLSRREPSDYYQRDLESAVGVEFVDRDYAPASKPKRLSRSKSKPHAEPFAS
jgi:hypothetical protein